MTPAELFHEVQRRGHMLTLFGGQLAIVPALSDPDPALYAALCARRHELLGLLNTAVQHMAKQALHAEFNDCDQNTLDRVLFTLRSATQHSCCQRAAYYLAQRNALGT